MRNWSKNHVKDKFPVFGFIDVNLEKETQFDTLCSLKNIDFIWSNWSGWRRHIGGKVIQTKASASDLLTERGRIETSLEELI